VRRYSANVDDGARLIAAARARDILLIAYRHLTRPAPGAPPGNQPVPARTSHAAFTGNGHKTGVLFV
jgi:hypothetical protein